MKQTLMILFIFLIGFTNLVAQNRTFEIAFNQGEGKSICLSSLAKITFSPPHMVLHYKDYSTENISMTDIKSMVFSKNTGLSNVAAPERVVLYPNPATEKISFQNLTGTEQTLEIYSVVGTYIATYQFNNVTETIDVSNLQSGVYIIKLDKRVFKFTKL